MTGASASARRRPPTVTITLNSGAITIAVMNLVEAPATLFAIGQSPAIAAEYIPWLIAMQRERK